MQDYARHQTGLLMNRLSAAINRAARKGDEQAVHDVRVAMRRLSRCLKVFAPFYPDGSWKKIRRRIAGLMTAAGAVRDCDIAMELVGRAGIARRGAIAAQLAVRRRQHGRELLLEIRRWKDRDYTREWRIKLGL
jgi:CHAD domain-containing protein